MIPSPPAAETAHADRDLRKRQVYAGQVNLLYRSANFGAGVTVAAMAILAFLQWGVASHPIIAGWSAYMLLVSVARFGLAWRYWRATPSVLETGRWGARYAIGAGLAGAGWGAAAVLLYPQSQPANQVFLVFMLGGMMLGAASILAPRPESFLAFLAPAGLTTCVRLVVHADQAHLAMGFLAVLFTIATLITTARIHFTILSSLNLKFENQDLVEDLQAAKSHAEALNEHLEFRVRARTAELNRSTERLREEIAQRERVEEELLRARKLESLGVFAGGIAHDFNNFLTVVQGNVEIARMDSDPDGPIHPILDQIAGACRQATFLSSQLLTFAKGGAPVRRLVAIDKLVMDAVHLARAGTAISMEVKIAEDLRPAEVDPGQIGQVLHNILLNARQAMPAGGIIEIGAENAVAAGDSGGAARVRISIRDYGCGIPVEVLPRIFDPYFTTKPGGSGIGLATAYAIVAKHGGTISVESKLGYGTVFTIDLPASADSAGPQAPAAQDPMAAHLRRGVERLLVMDDESALRKLLQAVLSSLGYEVQVARDGAEAIALCEDAKAAGRGFDAALLDLTVSGGMGGMEAARRLKELDPALKLIVSSGYADAPVMADFRNYGFDGVIPKPWSLPELSQVFRSVLIANADRNAKPSG
jgi:signal transduction histidine kinase/CheY-like chemotaxis protein